MKKTEVSIFFKQALDASIGVAINLMRHNMFLLLLAKFLLMGCQMILLKHFP